jgi:hypothetical protein
MGHPVWLIRVNTSACTKLLCGHKDISSHPTLYIQTFQIRIYQLLNLWHLLPARLIPHILKYKFMKYINNKYETFHIFFIPMWLYAIHTDSAWDTPAGALCFTAEKKVIQISELTSSQKLQTLPPKTIYLSLTAMLLQLQHCLKYLLFRATLFSEIKHFKLSYVCILYINC